MGTRTAGRPAPSGVCAPETRASGLPACDGKYSVGRGRSSEDDPLPRRTRSETRRQTGSGSAAREREPTRGSMRVATRLLNYRQQARRAGRAVVGAMPWSTADRLWRRAPGGTAQGAARADRRPLARGRGARRDLRYSAADPTAASCSRAARAVRTRFAWSALARRFASARISATTARSSSESTASVAPAATR